MLQAESVYIKLLFASLEPDEATYCALLKACLYCPLEKISLQDKEERAFYWVKEAFVRNVDVEINIFENLCLIVGEKKTTVFINSFFASKSAKVSERMML